MKGRSPRVCPGSGANRTDPTNVNGTAATSVPRGSIHSIATRVAPNRSSRQPRGRGGILATNGPHRLRTRVQVVPTANAVDVPTAVAQLVESYPVSVDVVFEGIADLIKQSHSSLHEQFVVIVTFNCLTTSPDTRAVQQFRLAGSLPECIYAKEFGSQVLDTPVASQLLAFALAKVQAEGFDSPQLAGFAMGAVHMFHGKPIKGCDLLQLIPEARRGTDWESVMSLCNINGSGWYVRARREERLDVDLDQKLHSMRCIRALSEWWFDGDVQVLSQLSGANGEWTGDDDIQKDKKKKTGGKPKQQKAEKQDGRDRPVYQGKGKKDNRNKESGRKDPLHGLKPIKEGGTPDFQFGLCTRNQCDNFHYHDIRVVAPKKKRAPAFGAERRIFEKAPLCKVLAARQVVPCHLPVGVCNAQYPELAHYHKYGTYILDPDTLIPDSILAPACTYNCDGDIFREVDVMPPTAAKSKFVPLSDSDENTEWETTSEASGGDGCSQEGEKEDRVDTNAANAGLEEDAAPVNTNAADAGLKDDREEVASEREVVDSSSLISDAPEAEGREAPEFNRTIGHSQSASNSGSDALGVPSVVGSKDHAANDCAADGRVMMYIPGEDVEVSKGVIQGVYAWFLERYRDAWYSAYGAAPDRQDELLTLGPLHASHITKRKIHMTRGKEYLPGFWCTVLGGYVFGTRKKITTDMLGGLYNVDYDCQYFEDLKEYLLTQAGGMQIGNMSENKVAPWTFSRLAEIVKSYDPEYFNGGNRMTTLCTIGLVINVLTLQQQYAKAFLPSGSLAKMAGMVSRTDHPRAVSLDFQSVASTLSGVAL
jgi:hypothetical protein